MNKTKIIPLLLLVGVVVIFGVVLYRGPILDNIRDRSGSQVEGTSTIPYDAGEVGSRDEDVPDLPDIDPDHTLDIPVTIQVDLPKSSEWTDDDLRALATSHRAVSNRFVAFTPEQIATMKAANPHLSVSQYLNLASGGFVVTRAYLQEHPELVIKKADGTPETRLLNANDKSPILDPANPEWRKLFIDAAVKAVNEGGADAIMADQAVIVNRLCSCFKGINPATGNVYTDSEWRDAMYEFLRQINEALGDKDLIVNSIVNGPEFYAEGAERFNDVVDGYVAEGWRGKSWWTTDQYPTVEQWQENTRLISDLGSKGISVVAVAKYSISIVTSEESFEQNELFWFASFMMVKGDNTGFSSKQFDPAKPINAEIPYPDYWVTDIGSPQAPYQQSGSVAYRDFERGKILVNPGKKAQEVDLGGTYTTLDGVTVTRVTVAPHTGAILTK